MSVTVSQLDLRPPETVMRLSRMGASFPTRLSFMRVLLRRLHHEGASVTRPVWALDDAGYGHAVYSVDLGGHTYSLIAFSQALDADKRSDRVIAEAWDAAFALFDGLPAQGDIDRLAANLPKQEAGRYIARELSISRANKSVRFFQHVVDRLSEGQQPDGEMVASIGYLMRTTAVYGNGKFGFSDRARISDRAGFRGSFQVEMLNVWLIRAFTLDLVEHIAAAQNPAQSVKLDRDIKRSLGIGNSTGLGMAPFLVNHNGLLNQWVMVRETALARVRAIKTPQPGSVDRVRALMARAAQHFTQWNVADGRQMDRILGLRTDWQALSALCTEDWLMDGDYPWKRLCDAAGAFSLECQEAAVALVLEPHGAMVDDLADQQVSIPSNRIDAAETVGELLAQVKSRFAFALDEDFDTPEASTFFWYVSESKAEPRLGRRASEQGADRETALDIARQIAKLSRDLETAEPDARLAAFLRTHPQHRHAVRRVQLNDENPYSEIHDNLIGENCLPIDMLRFKLAQFGASKFDPKSELWTRINMYQGAPLIDEIGREDVDNWWLPVLPGRGK